MGEVGGEVWFKVDAVEPSRIFVLNGVHQEAGAALARLKLCASLVPTWVQTCMMMLDGEEPSEAQLSAYLDFLSEVRGEIQGVLLYGLARQSMQPGAGRLAPLPPDWLERMGKRIAALGLSVQVSV